MQSILTRLLIAATSGFVSWYVYLKVAEYFGWEDALFIATSLIISIFVHELGHAYAYKRHGISSYMIFLVILGGVGPLDDKKAESLHDNAKLQVAIAGVIGNILVGLAALALVPFGLLDLDDAFRVVNLNAGLIAFNLVPLWGLDGARIAKTLFAAIEEHSDQRYASAMTAVIMTVGAVTLVFGNGQFIVAALFVHGIFKQAREDDPLGSTAATALSYRDQCLWARGYMATAAIGLVAVAFTPNWL